MFKKLFFKNLDVKKELHPLFKVVRWVLFATIVSIVLTLVYYFLFSLFIDTDIERGLRRENNMYEKVYPQMQEKENLLEDVILGLQVSDNEIYKSLFNTNPPTIDGYLQKDTVDRDILIEDIESHTNNSIKNLEVVTHRIENNMRSVLKKGKRVNYPLPPLTPPIKNLKFSQIGASVGDKLNPFYKVRVQHNGLDIIAPVGEEVYASADGVVLKVERSKGGQGNMVLIQHGGGYITKYAHLQDIKVISGRSVKLGQLIGTVGVSGKSFAPHLHYEVLKDTIVLDPVDYLFAALSPEDYVRFLHTSISTGQSMD